MQLPEAFINRTQALIGDEWVDFEQSLNEESPISIRLNSGKIAKHHIAATLQSDEKIPWASDAYYLSYRPRFTLDPFFHAGCYYVQEASSMFLEHFVQNYFPRPAKVLDLCAAPGGKSTHLSTLLPEESLLVANEVIRSRVFALAENLIKWGNPNTFITNNDPVEIGQSLPCFFDAIVADLPCSGEGMFRKNPSAVSEWSENTIRLCAERQRRIVAAVWPALKPGGILIYSTCTYNKEENEANIEWICKEFGAELLEEPHRFLPHRTKGEGFFIAGIRKNEEMKDKRREIKGKRQKTGERKDFFASHSSPFDFYLTTPADFTFIAENNRWLAIPSCHYSGYQSLKNSLKTVFAGTVLGEIKGKDLIPSHAASMSVALNEKAFSCYELNEKAALDYLRKETWKTIPSELSEGYALATYENCPLGFIKNIGIRINNLYPQEWRIVKI